MCQRSDTPPTGVRRAGVALGRAVVAANQRPAAWLLAGRVPGTPNLDHQGLVPCRSRGRCLCSAREGEAAAARRVAGVLTGQQRATGVGALLSADGAPLAAGHRRKHVAAARQAHLNLVAAEGSVGKVLRLAVAGYRQHVAAAGHGDAYGLCAGDGVGALRPVAREAASHVAARQVRLRYDLPAGRMISPITWVQC